VITRRSLLLGSGAALLAAGCSDPAGEAGVVRIALLANLTHAPVLAGLASGRIANALAPVRVESRTFRAGPRVMEALAGCAIDFGVSGPAPLVIALARTGQTRDAMRVVTGCASGGASLVLAPESNVSVPADLRGKALAVTQLGSTQDVSLRKYLRAHGLEATTRGGDVTMHALAASDIRTQMLKRRLDGAWLPEPWATRLVRELGAIRFVDERELWPGGRFASALVVARGAFARARPQDSARLGAAIEDEVERARREPAAARRETYDAIQALTRDAGPREWFDEAWGEVEFTSDPLAAAVETFAADAASLGVMPKVDCGPLFAGA
jgi:NitT/TauT family transport system substrate-binding protein